MLFRKRKSKRLVVLGLDGVPYSFLKKHMEAGDLPNLAKIADEGVFQRMNSVYPTVSSVAWSCYMTGKDPGGHGIFGFIDRKPDPFQLFIPDARNLRAETLWERLSKNGKKVVVINVPVTYPPTPVNGILIGGFLGTDINKIGYPPSISEKLKAMDYQIDVDAWKGREEDKTAFLKDLDFALDKRVEVAKHLMQTETWDFFQLHIMETDRINHFLWEHYAQNDPQYASRFLDFYRKLDQRVGELVDAIPQGRDNVIIVILSDHGFCPVQKEVYLNHWLEQEGYLKFDHPNPKNVGEMASESRAYSLIPGRIFVHLKGREEKGSVKGEDYESIRNDLGDRLLEMRDLDTGDRILRKVYKREELYHGPYLEEAADLIAVPYDGYDLKGNVNTGKLTHKGELVGMHTYDDAAVLFKGLEFDETDEKLWVGDVGRKVSEMFNEKEGYGSRK